MLANRHRQIINVGVPALAYLPGAVHILLTRWGEPCAVPCAGVLTVPLEQTYALAASLAGIVGQAILTLLLVVWAVNFLNQITRGSAGPIP